MESLRAKMIVFRYQSRRINAGKQQRTSRMKSLRTFGRSAGLAPRQGASGNGVVQGVSDDHAQIDGSNGKLTGNIGSQKELYIG
jgi:hypothetical protein